MKQKNILILHTDQLRYDGLGCCGNPYAITPHIDALAAKAHVFDRHIVANPTCMTSRASLFTGLYPMAHNVWTNGVPLLRQEYVKHTGGNAVLNEPITLADVFSRNGYETFSFGKLHLTPNMAPIEYGFPETWDAWKTNALANWHGPYYGFQHVENTCGHGDQPAILGGHYCNWLRANHPEIYQEALKDSSRTRPIASMDDLYPSSVPSELHNSTWLADRFNQHLYNRKDPNKPFFAFIGFPDPHHPFTPSYDIVKKFETLPVKDPADPSGQALQSSSSLLTATSIQHLSHEERLTVLRYTYAMIHQVDLAVGRIVSTLKEQNIWDDTVIVFTSDHGDFLCDHGLLYKGYMASDALLRVPLIIRIPGLESQQRHPEPVSNCDVMPTLAGLAGVNLGSNCHGEDIMTNIQSDKTHYAFAYATDGESRSVNLTIYDRRYRLTYYPVEKVTELYDHENDPQEIINLAGHPDIRAHQSLLMTTLKNWFVETTNPSLGRVGLW